MVGDFDITSGYKSRLIRDFNSRSVGIKNRTARRHGEIRRGDILHEKSVRRSNRDVVNVVGSNGKTFQILDLQTNRLKVARIVDVAGDFQKLSGLIS